MRPELVYFRDPGVHRHDASATFYGFIKRCLIKKFEWQRLWQARVGQVARAT